MVEFIPMSSTANREDVDYEFHLDVNCTAEDDVDDTLFRKMFDWFEVEETHKAAVEPFIATDEFVAKTEARHESALFEPEYGAEGAREENAFDSSKCNHSFGETVVGGVAPFESPDGFALKCMALF